MDNVNEYKSQSIVRSRYRFLKYLISFISGGLLCYLVLMGYFGYEDRFKKRVYIRMSGILSLITDSFTQEEDTSLYIVKTQIALAKSSFKQEMGRYSQTNNVKVIILYDSSDEESLQRIDVTDYFIEFMDKEVKKIKLATMYRSSVNKSSDHKLLHGTE